MDERPVLLFIGAFPPAGRAVRGGNVQDCRVALDSEIAQAFEVIPIDSTQVSVPPPPLFARGWPALRRLGQVVSAAIRLRPAAMLVFAATGPSFFEKSLSCVIARALGIRVLLFVRDGHFMGDCRQRPWFRVVARQLLRIPHFVLCQGPSWQRFFITEMSVDGRRCPVVENWVATDALLAIGRSRSYDVHGALRIVFLGWVTRGKGIHELVEAITLLASRGVAVELHVCGDGPDRLVLADRLRASAPGASIQFHGWVDDAGRLEQLRDADVFALPSHVEGFPNSLVEAMASGLPCITTPVGSIPDFIRDDENGLLVAAGEVGALADAIVSLQDASRRARLGRAAYELARERFTPAHAARELRSLVTAHA